ncbi:MAG: DUF4197 domain-containing protein [Pseudomonadota bacterium]
MKQSKRQISRRHVVIGGCAAVFVAPQSAFADGLFDRARGLLGRSTPDATSAVGALTETEAVDGLKEALSVGSVRVIDQVGVAGGYLDDPNIRVPLPGFLGNAQGALSRIGMSGLLDDLEVRLNRAAEAAAPQAKNLFSNAISEMSVDDALGIVRGPDDSATRYFQEKMTPGLKGAFRPIVETQLEGAGAIEAFDNVVDRYDRIPLAPSLGDSAKSDLVDHGVDAGLDGIFFYLAQEEAAIRNEPVKRTTDILKRVFG